MNDAEYILSLEAERDYLSDALKEAIEELDAVIDTKNMSPAKAQQHNDWMAWLRSALEEDRDD